MSHKKETIIIPKDNTSAGWFFAGFLALGLLVLFALAFYGFIGPRETVRVQLEGPEFTTENQG